MLRKVFLLAGTVALPVTAMTVVGTGAVAGAASVNPAAITCSLSGSVTFASPGLSKNGSTSASKNSTKSISIAASGTGCQNTPIGSTVTTKSTEKCKLPTSYPVCATAPKNYYVYDSDAVFVSGGVANLVKALHKGISVTDTGVPLTLLVTTAGTTRVLPNGVCGPTGVGYTITGVVKKSSPVADYTLDLCLTADSGPGTSGSFFSDLTSGTGTIASAVVGGPSSLTIG